ncbi:MAG: 3-phosphoshikimate 1-carboxyvinyltransferase [Opitutaceae bacterium]|jgi:3-phosphoshikimate 1-carboxyvinyltransferase|nr:3-phosphoshikimate 1-carboxyvinyltransferase [Opitutaceae bacterium]
MPPLPAQLPITPFISPIHREPFDKLPGSKSLTNRCLALEALCEQPGTLKNVLFSEDTRLMMTALEKMGLGVISNEKEKNITIHGRISDISKPPGEVTPLHVGLAGTAARFLTAFCAAARSGIWRLDGLPQMRRRPMRGLIEALRALGATVRNLGEEGFLPVEIHSCGLRGGEVTIDAGESSQMLSALLLVAPEADSDVHIQLASPVRQPFVEMTMRLMKQYGGLVDYDETTGKITVRHVSYKLNAFPHIEPDATAASYFLTLPLVTGGSIRIPGIVMDENYRNMLQGDVRYINVLEKTGAQIIKKTEGTMVKCDRSIKLRAVTENFNEFSDTFLTLAAIAPLLDGTTRIHGIAHTRKQETDRVAGMARELTRLGQRVHETEDALEITPDPEKMRALTQDAPIVIETHDDHRFAMSFAILGTHDLHGDGRPWLTIDNPACCAKTFPHFFDALESLRACPIEKINQGDQKKS